MRGGPGWDEAPEWMKAARERATEMVRELAREQMARRRARFEAVPEEVWEAAERESLAEDTDEEEGDD